MLKKFFKFSIYFISACLFALLSYYFVKVYLQNEPIIISKNFSNYEDNLKKFISKKTLIDKNKIKLKDVEFKLSKLDNFLIFAISNLKISNNLGEIISETKNLNVSVSFLDLFKNFFGNEDFQFQSIIIDKIDLSIIKTDKTILVDSSITFFQEIFNNKKIGDLSRIKINNLNFKITDKTKFLKEILKFECKTFHSISKINGKNSILNCYENKNNIKLNLKKLTSLNDVITLEGFFENLDLGLFSSNKNKERGKLNSDFNITFLKNFKIKKIDFNFKKNSFYLKKFNKTEYKFKFLGKVNYDSSQKKVKFRSFKVNNIPINADLKIDNKILKSDITLMFDNTNYKSIDLKLLQYMNSSFFDDKYKSLKRIFNDIIKIKNSKIIISASYHLYNKSLKILKVNSSGNILKKIENFNFKKIINLNATLSGFFKFNYENKKIQFNLDGNLKENNLIIDNSNKSINFDDIIFSVSLNEDYFKINSLDINSEKNKLASLKGKFWIEEEKLKLGFMDTKISNLPVKLFIPFYNQFYKKNKIFFEFSKGKVVNSKVFLKNRDDTGIVLNNKIEIIQLNFKNLVNVKTNLKFINLNFSNKNKTDFFGNASMIVNKIPINASYEVNSNGDVKAFGTIKYNEFLSKIIFKNSLLKVKNLNQIKFKTNGNLNSNYYNFKISSILNGTTIFHKVLNINSNNIKQGYFEALLNFRGANLKKIEELKLNFDKQNILLNANLDENNLISIKNYNLKNFRGKLINLYKKRDFWKIKIDGDLIDISHLANDFIDKKNDQSPKIYFDIVAKKIILNKNFSVLGNLSGKYENNKFSSLGKGKFFLGLNTLLDAGELNINVSKNKYLLEGFGLLDGGDTKITIISSKNNLPIVTFDTFTGGKLLSALDFTKKIKSGKMNLKIEFLNGNLSQYKGTISVEDFQIINAPKIIKTLTSLSFSGISSLFVGQGVYFKKGNAIFYKEGEDLFFNKIFVNNESLSIVLKGKYNMDKKNVNFLGSMAPFKLISKIISVVPAVGELLTGSNKKGLIAGQFRLTGKVYDPDVNLNVLSFTPGILREIFSRDWLK